MRWSRLAAAWVLIAVPAQAQLTHAPIEMSGGGELNQLPGGIRPRRPIPQAEPAPEADLFPGTFAVGSVLEAYSFTDNATLNDGFLFIPPDPIGAAGYDRLIAVVNVGIECRDKAGNLQWRSGLRNFFSPLGSATLGTYGFDPKILYDHHEDRFVVVALEQTSVAAGTGADASRILVAVSKSATPFSAGSTNWWYAAIDSKVSIGGSQYWADYPGFEVDEEAVYITANLFHFTTGVSGGIRLWILGKGTVGGFYAGGAASVNIHNPIGGGGSAITMQPAEVWGAAGAGAGIGTYLVGYNGLSAGGPGGQEAIQVIRVDNPLGSPTFTVEQPFVGDIENVGGGYGTPALPDAPQLGIATRIEVNDRRSLDAVWRDDALWFTTTIHPNVAYDPVNTGQTTAHWFKLDTSAVTSSASPAGLITLADQGNLGGEDLVAGATTFFPALAVNAAGEVQFGFSASAATIYAGAYTAGRHAADPPGTVGPTRTVRAGVAYYVRTFGTPRNRWGDYSGVAIDPFDERIFWVFNEYAWTQGSVINGENGRWRCAWRSTAASCVTVDCPGDASGHAGDGVGLSFCLTNCGALSEVMTYSLTDEAGWCTPVAAGISVAAGATTCIPVPCTLPPGACPPDSTVLTFIVASAGGEADTCRTVLRATNAAPTAWCRDLFPVGAGAPSCSAVVSPADVDAGASDPDGDALTFALVPPGPFPEGSTAVFLIATDPCGAADTCAATITVGCPVGPVLDVDPAQVFIPAVALGDTVCRVVTLRNLGDQDLAVLSVTGCETGGFSLELGGLGSTVPPGDSTAFAVCYAPDGAGPDSCEITVTTGDSVAVVPVHIGTVTSVSGHGDAGPLAARAVPNPFERSLGIRFDLPADSQVAVSVYDSQGRRVRRVVEGPFPAGRHEVLWDGSQERGGDAARGLYFLRVETPSGSRTVRAVKLR